MLFESMLEACPWHPSYVNNKDSESYMLEIPKPNVG